MKRNLNYRVQGNPRKMADTKKLEPKVSKK
jgi:hypothetical protein